MTEMKPHLILFVFMGVLFTGCASQQTEKVLGIPQPSVPVTSAREMVLLYQGVQNPGEGWERKSTSFGTQSWERRVSVNLSMSRADGSKAYSMSLNELGTLPKGKVWIGPVHGGSAIEKGATIGNMPTSTGAMFMLLIDPRKEVFRWWEP
jgi:hypothetical protein